MKAELHIHTNASACSSLSLADILEWGQKSNLDVVAICDHNTIKSAIKLRNMAPFQVIVGEEISTKSGDIVGLFLDKEIKPGLSVADTIRQIKKQGGLVLLPHPFDRLRRETLSRKETLSHVHDADIIETFNSRVILNRHNKEAEIFAKTHSKTVIVGTDAHSQSELGNTTVLMKPFRTPQEFLHNLAEARVSGRRSSPLVHLATVIHKIINRKN